MPQDDPGRAGDEQSIPKDRVDAMVGKERSEKERALAEAAVATQRAAEAEARLSQLKNPTEKTEDVTTEQIAEAMESGQLTQAQGMDMVSTQAEKRILGQMDGKFNAAIQQHAQSQSVEAELERYKALVPEIAVVGSDEDKQAGSIFESYIKMGLPNTNATRVAACRQAFGSIQSLEAETLPMEAHAEVGGAPVGGRKTSPSERVPPELLKNARLKEHYDEMIRNGHYTGYDDEVLLKEMKFA